MKRVPETCRTSAPFFSFFFERFCALAGTFSAVYKATLLRDPSKAFALKRVYLNSHPNRIEGEVVFLRDLGCRSLSAPFFSLGGAHRSFLLQREAQCRRAY